MRHFIGASWLRAFGWKIVGHTELPRRFVVIAAPHTSTWDFPFMIATAWSSGVRIRWLGKRSLFDGPFGWFYTRLGGIPVDRSAPQQLVQRIVSLFAEHPDLVVAIPAEGTRRRVDTWRSGFYHVASQANVPVGLGFLDYERRRCGVGAFILPTGDVRADMDRVRAFYRGVVGRHPTLQGEPRLREESA